MLDMGIIAYTTSLMPVVEATIFHTDSYGCFKANGKRFYKGPGGEFLYFRCPWCGRIHMHGSPGIEKVGTITTRGSHCQRAIDLGVPEYALFIAEVVRQ